MPIDLVEELTDLRRAILRMGASVEQRVDRSVHALLEADLDAARTVRTGDDEIDRMEVDIEEECLRILALTHPVAGDLRFVLAVMRVNACLERVADLARSIAKRVLDLAEQPTLPLPSGLVEMATQTRHMFGKALTALADEDAALARQVRLVDARVDDLQKEVFAWVQKHIPTHVDSAEAAIDCLSITRKLERIADISTNIAEEVIFWAEGAVVRHEKA
ncbi:MAG: phosphate signaling complex protein PhoU [Planctomycetota bacterium]|jgi:phosphate transport system protein